MRLPLTAALFSLLVAHARPARADHRPTLSTDAIYVGTRVDPGFALLAGWDLDVYLTRDRGVSVGPGVSLAVLGPGGDPAGRAQSFLLSADVLRLKLGLGVAGGALRPFVAVGGGFSFASLPAQVVQNVTVALPDGSMVTGAMHYPSLDEFAPMASLGAGADAFTDGPVGGTILLLAHFHPFGSSRVPDVWIELAVGLRFGL